VTRCHTESASHGWTYPCVLESGETIHLKAGRDYYWKRSEGWQWNGVERWWEYYVEIYPGMNGGGGVWIKEKSRWNGASDWQFTTPRNLTHEETCDLFRDVVAHLHLQSDEEISHGT
jgi:hypothetical protein